MAQSSTVRNTAAGIKNRLATAAAWGKGRLTAFLQNADYVKYIIIFFIIVVCVLIGRFIYTKSVYVEEHCATLKSLYSEMGKVASLKVNAAENVGMKLRDYYIKSAYNCCALGNFKNTYVSTCALKEVIRQGARCLDFEIYAVNNEPVVAVSTTDQYNFKSSYNDVPLADALTMIRDYAFSGSTCPNPNDPLILHFRLKTKIKEVLDKMSKQIFGTLQNRVLDKKYSYEYQGNNLGTVPIADLMGKVIIAVNNENPVFESSDLYEYVNIASGSVFLRMLTEYDIKFTPNAQELEEFNKKHMTIVVPNLGDSDANVPVLLSMKYGAQMTAMNYQNFDANLEYYENFFAENGAAFVLKPPELRYIPKTIPKPPAQNPALSYAPRHVKSDYYDFKI